MLEAEELVGHEFLEDEDQVNAVREMAEMGAREAIMTVPDGCLALLQPDEGGPVIYRATHPDGRGDGHDRLG